MLQWCIDIKFIFSRSIIGFENWKNSPNLKYIESGSLILSFFIPFILTVNSWYYEFKMNPCFTLRSMEWIINSILFNEDWLSHFIWMKMAPIGSYVWMIDHQLTKLFGKDKEVWPCWRRWVSMDDVWGGDFFFFCFYFFCSSVFLSLIS